MLGGIHPEPTQAAFPTSMHPNDPSRAATRRQVRRAQHTVHSETKYIELAVVNDHQLVSTGGPGAGGVGGQGGPPGPTWPLVPPQFLQLRKSVVLTSNFAKSVVNLADMVRGFVPGGGGCLWGRLSSPAPGGFVPGRFVPLRVCP